MNSGTGRKHFEAIPECSGFVNKRERRRAEWKKKAWRRKSMKRRKQEESTSIMKRMLLPATPRTSRRKIRHGGGALPADRIFSEERIRNVSLQQDHAADKTRGKRPGFCFGKNRTAVHGSERRSVTLPGTSLSPCASSHSRRQSSGKYTAWQNRKPDRNMPV